ncbi:MAG: hypothetical protein U1E19_08780 [Rhodoblastus sp.]
MTIQAAKACSDLFHASQPAPGSGALLHRFAVIALLARRAIWMAALCRVSPETPASAALSAQEIALIGMLERRAGAVAKLADALSRLAAIGGATTQGAHLNPFAVARGLSQIADIEIAQRLRAAKFQSSK